MVGCIVPALIEYDRLGSGAFHSDGVRDWRIHAFAPMGKGAAGGVLGLVVYLLGVEFLLVFFLEDDVVRVLVYLLYAFP